MAGVAVFPLPGQHPPRWAAQKAPLQQVCHQEQEAEGLQNVVKDEMVTVCKVGVNSTGCSIGENMG